MVSPQLLEYIRQQQAAGVAKEEIMKSLIAAGWQVSDVNEALGLTVAQPPAPVLPPSAAPTTVAPGQAENSQKLVPIGQLFADSFVLYRERFLILIALTIIPCLLLGLGQLLTASGMRLGLIPGIIGILLFIPAGMGIILTLSKGTGIAQSLRVGFTLFFPALWMLILVSFVMIGGYVMLIVPGILMSLWFSLSSFALVIEGKRGLNALLQSREYVRGHWWATLVRFLALYIPMVFIYLAYSLFGQMIGMVIYLIATVFIGPFVSVYLYRIYQNLTVLKPTLAVSQPTSGRGFLITSGIIGLIAPPILTFAFLFLIITRLISPMSSVAASSTSQSIQDNNATTTHDLTMQTINFMAKTAPKSGSVFTVVINKEEPKNATSWSLRIDCPVGVTADIQSETLEGSLIGNVMHCNEDITPNDALPAAYPAGYPDVLFGIKAINKTGTNQDVTVVVETSDSSGTLLNESQRSITVQP